LNVSALPCLLALLNSPKKGIKKEACWTISNLTAGNKAQIQVLTPLIIILIVWVLTPSIILFRR